MNQHLENNRKMLQVVETHIHLLEQGIIPPDVEAQALSIFKTRPLAIEGMLKARRADKVNFEDIIRHYEGLEG